jgi:hypothetical protein
MRFFGDFIYPLLRFYNMHVRAGRLHRRSRRETKIVMPTQLDPRNEVAVSEIPLPITQLAQRLIKAVVSAPGLPAHKLSEWNGVLIAPIARYLFDPLYKRGEEPAYVEFRVQSAGDDPKPSGYILVSLTREDRPIPEFSTRGKTKTDLVMAMVPDGTISKFVRYLPAYVVAEDVTGNLLGALGTTPFRFPAATATLVRREGSAFQPSERDGSVQPRVPISAMRAAYSQVKADFLNDADRLRYREQRIPEAEAAWRLAEGISIPSLTISVAQTTVFLSDKKYIRARALTVQPEDLIRLSVLPQGGIEVTGLITGKLVLRLDGVDASINFQPITVTPRKDGIAFRDFPLQQQLWIAGSGWDGDERQYSQLGDLGIWCPAVGCGPTALAMLFGWWDANGLPAVYYRLDEGAGHATQFRFNYESLRDSDAPKDSLGDNQKFVVPIYNDLHDLANTFCWANGEGSTRPEDLEGAFDQYVARIRDPLPSPQNEYGDQFVEGVRVSDFNSPGVLSDWEGGGKPVARGIQHGHPGIIGSYVGSHVVGNAHYPLALGYLILEEQANGSYVMLGQYFICNMGWGDTVQSYPCEEVWGGLTVNFTKKSTPMSPNDGIAATFAALTPSRVDVFTRQKDRRFQRSASQATDQLSWPSSFTILPEGSFRSGPAACLAADGQSLHVVGRGDDDRFWRAFSSSGGATWDMAWAPIGDGLFTSMPAIAVTADGMSLHIFGRGQDNHSYHAHSANGGQDWDVLWVPIDLAAVFTSGPAAAISPDGGSLHVIGRGTDMRFWRAYSPDQGANWTLAWAPIGDGIFRSNPALGISADAKDLHVFGRGTDDRIWRAHSPDGGATWDILWEPLGDGVFASSPAVSISPNGQIIHVFGVGLDRKVWRAVSLDGGASWPALWSPINAPDESNVF